MTFRVLMLLALGAFYFIACILATDNESWLLAPASISLGMLGWGLDRARTKQPRLPRVATWAVMVFGGLMGVGMFVLAAYGMELQAIVFAVASVCGLGLLIGDHRVEEGGEG